MIKAVILFLFVISIGNATDAPALDIIKITASEEEIIIDGAQLESVEGVALRSLDKKIIKEYQLDSATGAKVTAHTIDRRPIPSDKYLYLVVNKFGGEVYYPITKTSQADKKVFYKFSQKKKIKSKKKIEVDDKSEINFYPSQDFSGYDYDYSILVNSTGDLVIKGFDKNLFKIDQFGNLEIAGTLKVKGNTVVPYAPTNGNLRISNVVIGDDNNISGVVNFTSSGNMDVATSTFHVDSTNSRVGIGTSTPTYKLDVQGTTNSGIRLRQTTPSTNTSGAFFNGMVFDGSGTTDFGIGYGVGDLFSINSFDGTNYRNVFSLNNVGNGAILGSLKIGAYTLPAIDGAANTVLRTNGAGVVNWGTAANGDVSSTGAFRANVPALFSNTTGKIIIDGDASLMDFNTTGGSPAWKEGRLYYDSNTKSLAYYSSSNGISIELGQQMAFLANNNSGVTIPVGSAVYVTGSTGGGPNARPTIAMAQANSVTTSRIIGITAQAMPNNSDGYVTNFGLVKGLDTSGFASGAILYLSDTNAGQFTTTPPAYPVPAGRVMYSNNANGVIGLAPVVGAGNVFGPATSVDGRPAIFSGTSGKQLANTVPYTIPIVNGTNGQVLVTNGAGSTSWTTVAGTGNVVGSATSTINNLASFSDATGKAIKDSGINSVNINTMSALPTLANQMVITTPLSKELAYTPYTMPITTGTNGYVLKTDGAGAVTWQPDAGSTSVILTKWTPSTFYQKDQIQFAGVDGNWLIRTATDTVSDNTTVWRDVNNGKSIPIAPPLVTTGIVSGGSASLSGDTVTVQAGNGFIADYENSLSPYPILKVVEWPLSTINIAGPGIYTILINSSGQLISIPGQTNDLESTQNITVAIVDKDFGKTYNQKTYPTNSMGQLRSLAFFLGGMVKDLNYAGNANTTIQRSAYQLYKFGIDTDLDHISPNTKDIAAQSPMQFNVFTQTGPSGGVTTILNTSVYDNNGILTTMNPNRWGFAKLFFSIGGDDVVMYAQKDYGTQTEAEKGVLQDPFITPPQVNQLYRWVGYVVYVRGDNDLSNNIFLTCQPFGCGKNSGGSGGTAGGGDVFGPTSSTANRLVIFGDNSGKTLVQATFAPPSSTGTAGQVLTSNGDGTTKWGTVNPVPTRASLPSDRKLKKEIKDLTENYIDKIMDLRPVSFVWKDTSQADIGFIAQEVKKVFPGLVEEDAGYIGVNYQKMVVPLVKAFQEQQKEISRYKDAVSRLEERIEQLEKRR